MGRSPIPRDFADKEPERDIEAEKKHLTTTKNVLAEHIRPDSEKTIIVMGSYSGSSISRLLFKSTAELVINETHANLFITHQ